MHCDAVYSLSIYRHFDYLYVVSLLDRFQNITFAITMFVHEALCYVSNSNVAHTYIKVGNSRLASRCAEAERAAIRDTLFAMCTHVIDDIMRHNAGLALNLSLCMVTTVSM